RGGIGKAEEDEEEVEEEVEEEEVGEEEEVEENKEEPLLLSVLRPSIRTISKATISKRWKPLTSIMKKHLVGMLEAAVASVLPQVPGERRRIGAQQHLNQLVRKIEAKLENTTVPQYAVGKNFDHKRLGGQNKLLEITLLPEIEQIAEMEAELTREEMETRQDKEELHQFQEKRKTLDARNTALHKAKLHPLLKLEVEEPVEIDDVTIRGEVVKAQAEREREEKLAFLPDKDRALRAVRKSVAARLQLADDRTRELDDVAQGISLAERHVLGLMEGLGLAERVADRGLSTVT
ncbi:hypothetical protein BC937DRAFT_95463, partial [Endogone sp. FLAS-F59071]